VLSGRIVVSHTAFDRAALRRAITRYELPEIECQWLDSARVVRRTWTNCARSGYGLSSIADQLGIDYRHHDALEDARAAGKVLLRAIKESGIGIEDWLAQSLKPLGGPICREGNPAGPVYGEYIVFTGALQIPRHEAAAMAARIGFTVSNSVSAHTSVLVIGDQDISRLRPGESLSTKRRKAEALIASGCSIRIIGESDFLALCGSEMELERRALAEASYRAVCPTRSAADLDRIVIFRRPHVHRQGKTSDHSPAVGTFALRRRAPEGH
jgi:DNA polymerase III subunit epsilon